MTESDSDLEDPRLEDFVAEFLAARSGGSTTYEPREDSFLVLEVLAESRLHGLRVLDVGTGSGILAAYCARKGATVTATDIDINATKALKLTADKLGISIKLVACDLFSKVHGSFDIVVFNPPYLPSSTIDDRTIDGGEQGAEIINRFLDKLDEHLADDGIGLLVVSSQNNPALLAAHHPNLSLRTVSERSLFFEKLHVLELKAEREAQAQP